MTGNCETAESVVPALCFVSGYSRSSKEEIERNIPGCGGPEKDEFWLAAAAAARSCMQGGPPPHTFHTVYGQISQVMMVVDGEINHGCMLSYTMFTYCVKCVTSGWCKRHG